MVPGSPWPIGGDDDDLLHLIVPDLYQSSPEEIWDGRRKATATSRVGAGRQRPPPAADQSDKTSKVTGSSHLWRTGPPGVYSKAGTTGESHWD